MQASVAQAMSDRVVDKKQSLLNKAKIGGLDDKRIKKLREEIKDDLNAFVEFLPDDKKAECELKVK
jgi:ribosomal protein S13